jgi:hypothetical protein
MVCNREREREEDSMLSVLLIALLKNLEEKGSDVEL